MGTINQSIRLHDGMSRVLYNIARATDQTSAAFGRLRAMVEGTIPLGAMDAMRQRLDALETRLREIEEQLRRNRRGQDDFNGSLRNGNHAAGSLLGTLRGIAAAVGGLAAAKGIVRLTDSLSQSDARLAMVNESFQKQAAAQGKANDGLRTQAQLQDMVFQAAQRSRASYLDTAASISKLGLLAEDAFGSTDELVRFAELMNKSFVVSGSPIQSQTAGMYQLTQAMAAGKLQGDEFVSIMENASMLAQAIADFTGISKGELKELSSQGKITADIIKNALFQAGDEIERQFEQMPVTFAQAWTMIKNQAILAFRPVLERLSKITQTQEFQEMVTTIINALRLAADAALNVLEAMGSGIQFLKENWSTLAPAIIAATTALLAFKGAMAVSSIITSLANPLLLTALIIGVIVSGLYAFVDWLNKTAGTSESATGIIVGAFLFALAMIGNVFINLYNLSVSVFSIIWNVIASVAEFLANVFDDPIGSIVRAFGDMADTVLQILEGIASAMDALLGTNAAGMVNGWRDSLKSVVTKFVGEAKIKLPRINAEDHRKDLFDPMEAWKAGQEIGRNIENAFRMQKGRKEEGFPFQGGIAPPSMPVLNNIEKNTGRMADSMDMAEEDLKWMRDIAARDAVNRFTTAEIKVDMVNNNTVSSTMDLDGIAEYLGDVVYQQAAIAAEGAHY